MTEAASIAQQLAAPAGVEIAGVRSIVEGETRDAVRVEQGRLFMASAIPAAPTPLLESPIPISVTVFIEYEIG